MKNKIIKNWRMYVKTSLLLEDLKEEPNSDLDVLDNFLESDLERYKQGYKSSVRSLKLAIENLQKKLEKVSKTTLEMLKDYEDNMNNDFSSNSEKDIEYEINYGGDNYLSFYKTKFWNDMKSLSYSLNDFLKSSSKKIKDSGERIEHYRGLLSKEGVQTADLEVILSNVSSKFEQQIQEIVEKIEIVERKFTALGKQVQSDKNSNDDSQKEQAFNLSSLFSKAKDFMGSLFGEVIYRISSNFFANQGLESLTELENQDSEQRDSVIGEISFELDKIGSKSESMVPFINLEDGSKIPVYKVGDNPFENESLKELEGQLISVSKRSFRNGVMRIENFEVIDKK